MESLADRIEFLSRSPRLEIARLCEEEELTREQIAKALGRPSGSVSSTETLVKRGVLEPVANFDEPRRGRRGELLRLSQDPLWKQAVSSAQQGLSYRVEEGYEILLVSVRSVAHLGSSYAGLNVLWAAEVHGENIGLLMVLAPDATGRQIYHVMAAFEASGVEAMRLRVGRTQDAQQLSRFIAGFADSIPMSSAELKP